MPDSEQEQGVPPPSERARLVREELFGQDFTTSEAAYILGFEDNATVLKYRRDGLLPGYQIGREYRFPKSSLEQFRRHLLKEQEAEAHKAIVEREADRKYRRSQDMGTDYIRLGNCGECGTLLALEKPDQDDITYLLHNGHEWAGRRIWLCKCPVCNSYPQLLMESQEEVGHRASEDFENRDRSGDTGLVVLAKCQHCGTDAVAREQSENEALSGFEWPNEVRIDCEFCGRDSYLSVEDLLAYTTAASKPSYQDKEDTSPTSDLQEGSEFDNMPF
jgi:excisionase family DNA binding protein